jgi:hypothetical protein
MCKMRTRSAHRVLVAKPEGNRSLGRRRRIREDNIKMDLKEIICEVVEWIQQVQDMVQWRSVLNTLMKLEIP